MRDKKKVISNIQTRMQGMSQGSPEYANAQARLERVQARPTKEVRQAMNQPMQPAMRPQLPPQAAPQAQANMSQPMPRPMPQVQGQPQGVPMQQPQPMAQMPQGGYGIQSKEAALSQGGALPSVGDLNTAREQFQRPDMQAYQGQQGSGQVGVAQAQRTDLNPQVTKQVFDQLGAVKQQPMQPAGQFQTVRR
jgi:hypothetical protein